MKFVDRVKSSAPLNVVEIPDHGLNEKLVPMNDSDEPTSLSRESFGAGSVVSRLDGVEPRQASQIGPIVAVIICFAVLAASLAFLANRML